MSAGSGQTPTAPLHLAFVLWSGTIGGAETFVASLANVLRDSGVDAQIVFVTGAEPLAERLRETGVPFHELKLRRGRAVLWHARHFANVVRQAGADGAVLAAGGFLPLALRLGGYRGRVAAVEHGSVLQIDRMRRRSRLLRRVDQMSGARAVDVRVAVSDFLRDRLPRGPRPIVTIHNGVDLDLYRPSPPRGAEEGFVIGCVSRLIPGKGVEDVLVAAQPAVSRGARLRIAGRGPAREDIERRAVQLGIRDRVSFDGLIRGGSEVAAFWHSCNVAIVAPNDWVEAFGLAAVEAMACGRPVVATRGGALSETVVDGTTGFLVPQRDTDALAAALLAYQDDPSLSAAHGASARAWCEERFDIRRCASEYVRLFRRDPQADTPEPDLRADPIAAAVP